MSYTRDFLLHALVMYDNTFMKISLFAESSLSAVVWHPSFEVSEDKNKT